MKGQWVTTRGRPIGWRIRGRVAAGFTEQCSIPEHPQRHHHRRRQCTALQRTALSSGDTAVILRGNLTSFLLPGGGFFTTRSTRTARPRRSSRWPTCRARSSPSRPLPARWAGEGRGGGEDGRVKQGGGDVERLRWQR